MYSFLHVNYTPDNQSSNVKSTQISIVMRSNRKKTKYMKLSELQECSKSFEENKEHISFCNGSKKIRKKKSYRGVWQHSSGRYVAQVWNPIQQKQKMARNI